ncbi:MAG TPA: hypothetical protein VN039_07850 [Nitrospira sp.]|nr:hypothetical protein [Nitrospira sp.]
MESTYSLNVTQRNPSRYSIRGYILEDGIQIGWFRRPASPGFIPEMQFKFFTEHAEARFQGFCDSLSMEETVAAMAGGV